MAPYAFQFQEPGAQQMPSRPLTNNAYRIVHSDSSDAAEALPTATQILLPIPEVADAAAALAAVNVIYDTDGSLRFEQTTFRYAGDFYPSLPLAAARLWYSHGTDNTAVELGHGIALGNRFSLREFHNVVFNTGTVPLQILERQVDAYAHASH